MAKYAKVAGLDVKRFSKLVNEDMNAALLLIAIIVSVMLPGRVAALESVECVQAAQPAKMLMDAARTAAPIMP